MCHVKHMILNALCLAADTLSPSLRKGTSSALNGVLSRAEGRSEPLTGSQAVLYERWGRGGRWPVRWRWDNAAMRTIRFGLILLALVGSGQATVTTAVRVTCGPIGGPSAQVHTGLPIPSEMCVENGIPNVRLNVQGMSIFTVTDNSLFARAEISGAVNSDLDTEVSMDFLRIQEESIVISGGTGAGVLRGTGSGTLGSSGSLMASVQFGDVFPADLSISDTVRVLFNFDEPIPIRMVTAFRGTGTGTNLGFGVIQVRLDQVFDLQGNRIQASISQVAPIPEASSFMLVLAPLLYGLVSKSKRGER
jgi:hypothetical protein